MGKYAQCLFNEMNGKALDTKFQIRCFDIHDVDTPLTYSWFYLPGNSTKDWTACTFPRQGKIEFLVLYEDGKVESSLVNLHMIPGVVKPFWVRITEIKFHFAL